MCKQYCLIHKWHLRGGKKSIANDTLALSNKSKGGNKKKVEIAPSWLSVFCLTAIYHCTHIFCSLGYPLVSAHNSTLAFVLLCSNFFAVVGTFWANLSCCHTFPVVVAKQHNHNFFWLLMNHFWVEKWRRNHFECTFLNFLCMFICHTIFLRSKSNKVWQDHKNT